jgi:DNA-binding IclR family transcriptional regulator
MVSGAPELANPTCYDDRKNCPANWTMQGKTKDFCCFKGNLRLCNLSKVQTGAHMNANKTRSVPALERALMLLEMLANSKNGLTLSQLVDATRLPKSSLHCLLVTLERNGYLHRSSASGRYMFGLRLTELACNSLVGLNIRERAAPFLIKLMHELKLTVHMGVLDPIGAVVVAKYDPPASARLATWNGKKMDVHCTGLGKALGAYMPDRDLEALYTTYGFPLHNGNTITSLSRLRQTFAVVRERMYAVDDEEDEIGMCCIGTPIFNENRSVVAAISIAGTRQQITGENRSRLAERLKHCASVISNSWALN